MQHEMQHESWHKLEIKKRHWLSGAKVQCRIACLGNPEVLASPSRTHFHVFDGTPQALGSDAPRPTM